MTPVICAKALSTAGLAERLLLLLALLVSTTALLVVVDLAGRADVADDEAEPTLLNESRRLRLVVEDGVEADGLWDGGLWLRSSHPPGEGEEVAVVLESAFLDNNLSALPVAFCWDFDLDLEEPLTRISKSSESCDIVCGVLLFRMVPS